MSSFLCCAFFILCFSCNYVSSVFSFYAPPFLLAICKFQLINFHEFLALVSLLYLFYGLYLALLVMPLKLSSNRFFYLPVYTLSTCLSILFGFPCFLAPIFPSFHSLGPSVSVRISWLRFYRPAHSSNLPRLSVSVIGYISFRPIVSSRLWKSKW